MPQHTLFNSDIPPPPKKDFSAPIDWNKTKSKYYVTLLTGEVKEMPYYRPADAIINLPEPCHKDGTPIFPKETNGHYRRRYAIADEDLKDSLTR